MHGMHDMTPATPADYAARTTCTVADHAYLKADARRFLEGTTPCGMMPDGEGGVIEIRLCRRCTGSLVLPPAEPTTPPPPPSPAGPEWTHSICAPCWQSRNPFPGRAPLVMTNLSYFEPCCFCGSPTVVGIYTREDPATLRCRGLHPEAT